EDFQKHQAAVLGYLAKTTSFVAVNYAVTPGPFEATKRDVAALAEHLADAGMGPTVVGPILTWLAGLEVRDGVLSRAATLHEKAVRSLSLAAGKEAWSTPSELMSARFAGGEAGRATLLHAAALSAHTEFQLSFGTVDLDRAIDTLRGKVELLSQFSMGGL